jgi:hypothetical protein
MTGNIIKVKTEGRVTQVLFEVSFCRPVSWQKSRLRELASALGAIKET